MAQWMNIHQDNSFLNQMRLPLFCEISGAVHLALVYARWQTDEIQVNFENFRIRYSTDCDIRLFASFNKGTASL